MVTLWAISDNNRPERFFAILNLNVALMPSIKCGLNLDYGLGGVSFEECQDGRDDPGGQLECQNGTNLAVLNLHVSLKPRTRFQLNHLPFESRCRFKIFKLATLAAILDLGTEQIYSSKSPCHPNASHQVWAQSNLPFRSRRSLKIQDSHSGGHLGYWNKTILAILNLYVASMPPIKFQLNPTWFGRRTDVVWRFSRWPRWPTWGPSWISKQNEFINSISPCGPNASHQVWT